VNPSAMAACRKINILFVLPNFGTGGSEKLVLDLVKNVDKDRFNPVLVVFFSGAYEEEVLNLGVPFYVIHENGLRSKLSTFVFLKRIVRKHKIHIVNTHHISPLIQGLLPFKIFGNTVLIHTEHTRFDLKNFDTKVILLAKLFLKKVDVALGISQGICNYFTHELAVPQEKVRKIVNGVDMHRFVLQDFDPLDYRAKLGFGRSDRVIGMFANFRPQKNHPNIIRAAAILRDRGSSFKVLLCGTGDTEIACRKLVNDLHLDDKVIFMGVRFDIPELMSILDIYCLPSRFEGLPFSVLEAMACGKPVVATNVMGIDEVVKHGETGILVTADSPRKLADALAELIENEQLRHRFGRKGLQRVREFSFEAMLASYERLFEEVYYKHARRVNDKPEQ